MVQECSWMSGIRFDFHHSTYYCRNLSFRHPSSASLAGSEVPSSLAASPRGKPRTQKPLDITIQRSALLRERRKMKTGATNRSSCFDTTKAYKPGSVLTAIYLAPQLPVGSSRLLGTVGRTYCPSTALLRDRVYIVKPMLPWAGCALTAPFHPYPAWQGGISLLHLS